MSIYVPAWIIYTILFTLSACILVMVHTIFLGIVVQVRERYLKWYFRQSNIIEFRPIYKEWLSKKHREEGDI